MIYPLVVESSAERETRSDIVVEDYGLHPRLCRSGIWVGLRHEFVETVVLAYKHGQEQLMVGWSVNGVTVIDPGMSSGTLPYGEPAPGATGVSFTSPYENEFHNIAFQSTAGGDEACLSVQVLYRPATVGPTGPPLLGPSMEVCLSGSRIEWPKEKLAEEEQCIITWADRLRRHTQVARVLPGDPVERWLERAAPDQGLRLSAGLQALDELHRERDGAIVRALETEIRGMTTRFRHTDLLVKGHAPESSRLP